VTDGDSGGRHVDDAEHNRQLKAARPDRAWVEYRDALVLRRKRHVRMTADDETRIFCPSDAGHVCAESGAIDRHMGQQDIEQGLITMPHRDGNEIGQIVAVDIAAHRRHRRVLFQRAEDGEIADIARVKNMRRREIADARAERGMRVPMGIGHGDDSQRFAVEPKLLSRVR